MKWLPIALCCAISCVLGAGALASRAVAQAPDDARLSGDEEARMRFELGRRYYDTGRFADAAREFAEAHRLSGRTELLYNLFLAYRDAGDDVHAAETLRAYLPTLEAGERRTQLEARLRVLEQRLAGGASAGGEGGETTGTTTTTGGEGTGDTASGAGGAEATGGGATASGGSGDAAPGTGSASGGGLGVVPWVVIGIGGALVVASVITGVLALDARATLDRMCTNGACPPGFEATQSSGQGLAITTDALWITGALAIGAGAVLAVVDLTSSSGPSGSASVAGACSSDGCFVAASGRF